MMALEWTSLFNPNPTVSTIDLFDGQICVVLDDVLNEPDRLVAWASSRGPFTPPSYPYPGLVADIPHPLLAAASNHFDRMLRDRLGYRRQTESLVRLSLMQQAASALRPIQWLCHRDRIAADPSRTGFAASVLYLFHDPALGGTDFYRPKQSAAETDQLIADSQRLDATSFSKRYGLTGGYMAPDNPYFEHIARVPAAWNRLIAYDGGVFHSAAVDSSTPLHADPTRGRLTLNGFYTCTRPLRS